ncbi:hypothetical protein [Micromonospora aurantiaca (nom. illeg.)]|uniref:hypothetical protein n=1 Tax=Micromonospora aurantiaca (nom. illeg.) TaxID=47850 RepID=UPI0011ABE472|nr:hypothetical protein [Micromonospora aurantiaca]MBC9000456.1 hypothetical protein [Micromonospora aurantiaca]
MIDRLFALRRDADPTGMSGTGTVAYGATLPGGRALVQWLSDRPSTVVWRTVADAEHIHSHGGTQPTAIVWLDPTSPEAATARETLDAGMQLLTEVTGTAVLAETFRAAADGRRELARGIKGDHPVIADNLNLQALALDDAARVAGGDLTPLYNWLPPHRWTEDMHARLYGKRHQQQPG